MSRILFATVPIVGHINPLLPLARALVGRGHDVRWYSGPRHRPRIEATGAKFIGFIRAHNYNDLQLDAEFPARAALKGLDQLRFDLMRTLIDAAPGQLADIEAIVNDWPPDVIVADPTMFGAAVLHKRRDIRLAI